MRIQSCVELGSAAFHLFLWGRRTVFVCSEKGGKKKKNMAHKEHSKFATGNQFI